MFHSKHSGISHRDWSVRIVPHGPAFAFYCHHSNLGSHTNGSLYPTAEAAVIAGCNFIDREQALLALGQVLDEWMNSEKITLEEYWNLSNFCSNPDC